MSELLALVTAGRGIIAASRRDGHDEKFELGDMLADAQLSADDELTNLAKELGDGLTAQQLKSYRDVAKAWPVERRVDASWTTHRTLAKVPNRFDLIAPGMTLRQAQAAAGKRTSDVKHPSRWPLPELVDFLVTQLQDGEINKAVRAQVEGRKHHRSVRAAARSVEEERSAEYREALRELRERNNAKHPQRAAYEAIFKLRDAEEYVRAVGRASGEGESFLPSEQRPDVLKAVRDLALTSMTAIDVIGEAEPSAREQIAELVLAKARALQPAKLANGYSGTIITGETVN